MRQRYIGGPDAARADLGGVESRGMELLSMQGGNLELLGLFTTELRDARVVVTSRFRAALGSGPHTQSC